MDYSVGSYRRFIVRTVVFALAILSVEVTTAGEQWVQYLSGQDTVKAYLALPEGEGPFPAIIVIHEWWGLNDWVTGNADLFAKRGYAALAIDLYRGKNTMSAEEAHELMRGLPEDRAAKDLRAAALYLRSRKDVDPERIGSIGWCMGGGYSLVASMTVPDLAASVVCYGRIVSEPEEVNKIGSPLLGIFGEADRGILISDVRKFDQMAKEAGKDVTIVAYPKAGHAFMNPNNKSGYLERTSEDAWSKILTFFNEQLHPDNDD